MITIERRRRSLGLRAEEQVNFPPDLETLFRCGVRFFHTRKAGDDLGPAWAAGAAWHCPCAARAGTGGGGPRAEAVVGAPTRVEGSVASARPSAAGATPVHPPLPFPVLFFGSLMIL